MIKILVDGEPIPAARPRFSDGRVYQPARNREYRAEVEWAARQVMKDSPPLVDCALSAVVKLYRRYRPTSQSFGDVDNHLKAIFDALQGIVFSNDAQIVRCEVEKHTDAENPRAEIEIAPAAVSV